jgi:hypothetical protein
MNPYKQMYVLTEDEYNRLKLATHHPTPEVSSTPQVNVPVPVNNSGVLDEKLIAHIMFKCSICGKEYSNKRDRRRHIQKAHPQPTVASLPTPVVETKPVVEVKPIKNRKRKVIIKAFDNISKWMTMND